MRPFLYAILALFFVASAANAQSCPNGRCGRPLALHAAQPARNVARVAAAAPAAAVRATAHVVHGAVLVATAPVRFVAKHKPVRRVLLAGPRLLGRAIFRPQRRFGRCR